MYVWNLLDLIIALFWCFIIYFVLYFFILYFLFFCCCSYMLSLWLTTTHIPHAYRAATVCGVLFYWLSLLVFVSLLFCRFVSFLTEEARFESWANLAQRGLPMRSPPRLPYSAYPKSAIARHRPTSMMEQKKIQSSNNKNEPSVLRSVNGICSKELPL